MFQRFFTELRAARVPILATVCLVITAPAPAQPMPDLRSIAHGIIESANADGVFEYVHDGHITLRHIQSGLICRFSLEGKLVILPGLPRGEDVSCDQTDGRETVTLYATRYPEARTLAELMTDARATFEQRFPTARSYLPQAPIEARRDTFTSIESAHTRYLTEGSAGERIYSRISLAVIDDWALTLRYSMIAPDEASLQRAEIEASAHWSGVVRDFMLHRAT